MNSKRSKKVNLAGNKSHRNCEIIGTNNYCKIVKLLVYVIFSIALKFFLIIIVISIGFCTLSVIIRPQREKIINKYHSVLGLKLKNRKYKKKVSSLKEKFSSSKRSEKDSAMKVEVNSAADFMMNLLRVRQQVNSLSETQLHSFRGSLIVVLLEKYNNHWYETNPRKGESDSSSPSQCDAKCLL